MNQPKVRIILRGLLSMLVCSAAILVFRMPSSGWLVAIGVPSLLTGFALANLRKAPIAVMPPEA